MIGHAGLMYRTQTGLRVYWGKLPHWRMPGVTYFVTWRIKPGLTDLSHEERDLVIATLLKNAVAIQFFQEGSSGETHSRR